MTTKTTQCQTLMDLPTAIASFSRCWDPYGFADSYDTLEDCADQVRQLLEDEPETIANSLEYMAEESKEDERRAAYELLSLVRSCSRA